MWQVIQLVGKQLILVELVLLSGEWRNRFNWMIYETAVIILGQ
jgi:hypothetical protein